jgi:hypothetical protein
MSGTQGSSSPAIYQTRQKVDDFTIAQTPLGGAGSAVSDVLESRGQGAVRILARANATSPGTVEVYQAVTNPAGGPTFALTESKVTAVDPTTGEFVTFFDSIVYGEFARVIYVNGAGVQAAFEISAYGLPISAGSGSAAPPAGAAEPCMKVFCYLTFA